MVQFVIVTPFPTSPPTYCILLIPYLFAFELRVIDILEIQLVVELYTRPAIPPTFSILPPAILIAPEVVQLLIVPAIPTIPPRLINAPVPDVVIVPEYAHCETDA